MRKKDKRKKTKPIGTKEYIFNIISLLAVIGVLIYFGVRSFYYYNVENFKVIEGNKTLNGTITINNKVAKEATDGLHHDTNGYYYKGKVSNNYVKFANRLFRVIRINNDNTVKIISEDLAASFMWGENSSYDNSNLKKWLSTDNILGIYYKTLPKPDQFLVHTEYREDQLNEAKVVEGKDIYKDYLTPLTITDYFNAGGKDSFINNNHAFWILGQDKNADNLYIDIDGSIESAQSYDSYGVRVVLTLKKDLNILSGDGTFENPYVINQNNNSNYVDNFVKLGNDLWKINYDDGTTLKMYLTKTFNETGSIYGNNSLYDYNDYWSLANYYNFSYYPNLPYSAILNEIVLSTGEISEEYSFDYKNIYSSNITCRVGMLNMFDYYSGGLDNFFLMNTTSSIGSMVYVYHNDGILEEARVNEERLSIPVISINKNLIKNGEGTSNNPFIIE